MGVEELPELNGYGKSEGDRGAVTEFASHDGISLIASYFVFDGTLVVLGTDI